MCKSTHRRIFTVIILVLLSACAFAQTPQYYNTTAAGIGNSIPFGSTAVNGYLSQYLMLPNEYSTPSPAPAGNITKLYIYMSTAGTGTFTQFTVKMGQSSITVFPTGTQYTGPMDTVYWNAAATFTSSGANTWMAINLTRPFAYNPSQSLIIQISHCGFSGGSGMNVWQQSGTTGVFRRNNVTGTTSCVFTYSSQDSRILQNGIDVVSAPAVIVNKSIVLPTPGVNTNYVQIPYNAGMTGWGNNITIEAWMRIGGTTTANTVLNKGAASFDYQLGINASTALPFFRAGSTILTGTVPIPAGIWTHLAVTFNGSQAIFYVNGTAGPPQTGSATLGTSTNEMRIGRGNNDAGSGKIDEVRLWSVVRTPTEINQNMCVKWIPNSATGIKAIWHFDSTFVDSVSGWNGTPMGSVTFDTAMNCTVTGTEMLLTEVPSEYKLYQNYPNPFNPKTTIRFSIPKAGYVEMKLYDILGKEVAVLVSDPYQAGEYRLDFNASNLPSGTYFYRLVCNGFADTKKMILIK